MSCTRGACHRKLAAIRWCERQFLDRVAGGRGSARGARAAEQPGAQQPGAHRRLRVIELLQERPSRLRRHPRRFPGAPASWRRIVRASACSRQADVADVREAGLLRVAQSVVARGAPAPRLPTGAISSPKPSSEPAPSWSSSTRGARGVAAKPPRIHVGDQDTLAKASGQEAREVEACRTTTSPRVPQDREFLEEVRAASIAGEFCPAQNSPVDRSRSADPNAAARLG